MLTGFLYRSAGVKGEKTNEEPLVARRIDVEDNAIQAIVGYFFVNSFLGVLKNILGLGRGSLVSHFSKVSINKIII